MLTNILIYGIIVPVARKKGDDKMPNMEISENLIRECIEDINVLKSFELQAKSQGNIYAQVVIMKVHEALKIDREKRIPNEAKSYQLRVGA